ncbi:hypothetical protein CCAE64S_02449 [Castellaniella caeni]
MELDNDLKDALTYLDEARRAEALAHLQEAENSPAEFALRRKAIMAEAEEAAGLREGERRAFRARRPSLVQKGQTPESS